MHNYIKYICEYKMTLINELVNTGQLVVGTVIRLDRHKNLHTKFIFHNYTFSGIIHNSDILIDKLTEKERYLRLLNYVGAPFKGYIQKYEKGTFIINMAEWKREERADIIEKIEVGDRVMGIVKSVQPYGIFIDIGGDLIGLLHQSKIKYELSTDFVNIGDTLIVDVIGFDKENLKLEFGYSDVRDPWETVGGKVNVNEVIVGTALNQDKGMQFIRIQPGIDGVVPVRNGSYLPYGSKVNVKIVAIDEIARKIRLELIV